MSEIIYFLLAYPFVGYALAKISNKLFSDDTPTKELGFSRKIPRMIFFPVNYYNWEKKETDEKISVIRTWTERNPDTFCRFLIFLWPLSSIFFVLGLFQALGYITIKSVYGITEFAVKLPEKSYSLLQSWSRQIKLLTLGNNRDIKTSISQIEEFRDMYLKSERNKIIAQQNTVENRLCVVKGGLEGWQVVVRKNVDTAAKINPIIESLGKEVEMLASKRSDLFQLQEKLNAAEKSLSESLEILWRCLSTIPLGVPVYTEGPQLIKGDYVATLAVETISQAENEMSRIKDEIETVSEGQK